MNKVLSWGTIVYFLVLGFSLNQHALFELSSPDEQKQLVKAKQDYARTVESQATPPADVNRAELNMKAAQAKFDAQLLEEERKDGKFRAVGLMIGASIFCLGYPIVIIVFYRKTVTRYGAKYFIPGWLAFLYGVGMSAVTLYVALLTAIR